MIVVVSTTFRVILFPSDGKVITMDQLSFYTSDYSPLPNISVPLVGGVTGSFVSIGIDLLKASSMMGCFPLPSPQVP